MSRFGYSAQDFWDELDLVSPYNDKQIRSKNDLADYLEEYYKDVKRLNENEINRLRREKTDAENEARSEKSKSAFRGWAIAFLIAAFIISLLFGWVHIKPVVDKKVEDAYLAGASDLNSSLESAWEENGAEVFTLPNNDFTKANFKNIKNGISWLDFCETVNMPSFYHQFPVAYVEVETDTTSYEFTFKDEKLIAKRELKVSEISSPETDSSNKEVSSPQKESKSTPSPTAAPEMAWIPTHGGKRYHRYSTCSSMDNPDYVTVEEAESRGFTPCGKCW